MALEPEVPYSCCIRCSLKLRNNNFVMTAPIWTVIGHLLTCKSKQGFDASWVHIELTTWLLMHSPKCWISACLMCIILCILPSEDFFTSYCLCVNVKIQLDCCIFLASAAVSSGTLWCVFMLIRLCIHLIHIINPVQQSVVSGYQRHKYCHKLHCSLNSDQKMHTGGTIPNPNWAFFPRLYIWYGVSSTD